MTLIRSSAIWPVSMPLTEPYTIAYETIDHTDNIFLKLETNDGLTGFGCAAPDWEVTGETAETVTHNYEKHVEPLLHRQSPFQIARLMADLRQYCPKAPSLLAMVDIALHDLLAKRAKIPLYQLLGGYRSAIPTSITIGILPVAETLEKAISFVKSGFQILKIKGGIDVENDIERLFKLRENLGRNIILRFDANQGYSVAETVQFVKAVRSLSIEILEQPTPSEDLEMLGAVTRQVNLPVMADESLLTLRDAYKLAKYDWADMVNIKLMKVGGIAQAMHINSIAKAAGMEAMIGCMDESALGISAGLHFALARPNVEFADLDGHLDLMDDPAAGCFRLENGTLYPLDKPGLGLGELF